MPYRAGIEPYEYRYVRQTGGKHVFLRVELQAAANESGPLIVAVASSLGVTELVDALFEGMNAEASNWSSTPLSVTVTAIDAHLGDADRTVIASIGRTALCHALERWNQPPEGGVREPRRPLPGEPALSVEMAANEDD